MPLDPASIVIIVLNLALIAERVVSRVKKSTCCNGTIEFQASANASLPSQLGGGALRSPPDDRDLIYENYLKKQGRL